MFSDLSDLALISRIREGNKAAVTALYLRYVPLLHSRVGRYQLPECDFEDIYQEASIGFLVALHRYDESKGVPFAAYITVCVENTLKNYAAAQYTQKMKAYRERVSLEELPNEMISDGQNPEMLYLIKEQWASIFSSISNKLSNLEREILVLYLCGHNYEFIASKLGISQKSVDNALQRVRRKLKKLAMEDGKS